MRRLFHPAIALMNRLSYTGKFGLVWLLSALAIAFVVFNLHASLDKQIRHAQKELQGIALAAPISRSIQLLQQHRGLSLGILGGQRSLGDSLRAKEAEAIDAFNRMTELLPTNLKSSTDWYSIEAIWQRIRNEGLRWRTTRNFIEHTRLIDQLLMFKVAVSGEYVLPLDPQIDSSYLIDAAINRLPLALEHLGQIRAHGTAVLVDKRIDESQIIVIRTLTAQLGDELKFLRADLDRARNHNAALQAPLLRVDREVTESAQKIILLVESSMLSGRLEESPEAFFALATTVIDGGYTHLYETLLPTIEMLIRERIAMAEGTLYTTLGFVCLLFLLVIYFSVGAYYATTDNITALARSAKAFAEGQLSQRVRITSRDELRQVGDSFNEMAHGFAALLAARAEDERRHHSIIETALDAMVQINSASVITGWNPQAAAMFGWSRDEAMGRVLHETIIPLRYRDAHVRGMTHFKTAGDGPLLHRRIELYGLHRDGREFPIDLAVSAIKTGDGYEFSGFIRDMTEKKKSEDLIWRQANYDELTGLPNRRMFYDRLAQEIKKADRAQLIVALLFVDLDRFKEVNDTLGHRIGDALLVEAAQRIQRCVRETDTVARLGGDEFVIILAEVASTASIDRIANNILGALADVFTLESETVYLSASIGITLYPQDATEIEDLLKEADQAMYLAKSSGRNRISYFTAELQQTAQARLRMLNSLRGALAANQFEIHFQPIVELASGKIRKAEALIRWQHPENGLISPAQFIPLAEETGLIVEIGDWVFRQSTRQLKQWHVEHGVDIQISVNKSPIQFKQANGSSEQWFAHLRELDLDERHVVIEITEGLLLDPEPLVNAKLQAFRNVGMKMSIDDFGTGYSSLSYLKNFEFDFLKIDRSFIRNLSPGSSAMELCEAIIAMAHKLRMKVIAEGVETEVQRALLAEAGCDYAQGYLFSKPVPAAEFGRLLRPE
ncbi:MAG: EAL domain-containing protein [Rhodocyclaceae bacterium]|nr:EAL domain-containing protein [Rhodocyclaceae bacterium]